MYRFVRARVAIAITATVLLAYGLVTMSATGAQDHQDHSVDENMVLENDNAYLMAMGEGSRIEIHAADAEKQSWTSLAATASAGSSTITVQDSTGWEVGDEIALSSTNYDFDDYEEFTIRSISADGKTITLDGTIQNEKLGETLRNDNGLQGANRLEWEAETRAEVALLSRNVTIQGDADSVADGFGAHTMIHGGAEQHIEGVEYFRVGQKDLLGRYPTHWHMLGDAEGQYVKNVSIHDSYQKGVTIHGTSNVMVEDSVVFNHVGHGVFFEDGSENNNLILDNLVFGTHASETGLPIITDESFASSYWIENPNNVFVGNVAGGSEQNGFAIFPDNEIHGDSVGTPVGEMGSMADLIFRDNVAHSNDNFALSVEGSIDPDTLEVNFGGVQDGQFATIDNYVAYSNIRFGAWVFTNDLIIKDSQFIGGRFGGLMSKGGAFVEDSLFSDNRGTGVYSYTQGSTRFDGAHFNDNDGDLFVFSGVGTQGGNAFANTTADGDALELSFNGDDDGSVLGNQRYIVDTDGSLSGLPGATITSKGVDASLNAAPGSYLDTDLDAWVSNATVGTLSIRTGGDLRVVRSDGESTNDYAHTLGRDFNVKTAAGMAKDVAYLLDFSNNLSGTVRANAQHFQDGQSAVYQFANIEDATVNGATEVSSFDALLSSNSSSFYLNGGNLFLRAVAVSADQDRPVDDIRQDAGASFQLRNIDSVNNPVNNPQLSSALLNAIDNQPNRSVDLGVDVNVAAEASRNDTYDLQRYASTSDTVDVHDGMPRWSNAETWGNGSVPGPDDIVVVGHGQTVVLDSSATVQGIIVNGGQLIIEDGDNSSIDLSTDYLLVVNGGLFQGGTEDDLLDTNFTLTLEGDDPEFDLEVGQILAGNVDNTVVADADHTGEPHTPTTTEPEAPTTTGDVIVVPTPESSVPSTTEPEETTTTEPEETTTTGDVIVVPTPESSVPSTTTTTGPYEPGETTTTTAPTTTEAPTTTGPDESGETTTTSDVVVVPTTGSSVPAVDQKPILSFSSFKDGDTISTRIPYGGVNVLASDPDAGSVDGDGIRWVALVLSDAETGRFLGARREYRSTYDWGLRLRSGRNYVLTAYAVSDSSAGGGWSRASITVTAE